MDFSKISQSDLLACRDKLNSIIFDCRGQITTLSERLNVNASKISQFNFLEWRDRLSDIIVDCRNFIQRIDAILIERTMTPFNKFNYLDIVQHKDYESYVGIVTVSRYDEDDDQQYIEIMMESDNQIYRSPSSMWKIIG